MKMSFEDDSIFQTIHSLPVLGHSLAIATRSPTVAPNQESRFMPDYGGILETPKSGLKNNGLAKGFTFKPKSSSTSIENRSRDNKILSNDCLVAVSYLDSDKESQFSCIQALDKNLFLDSIELPTSSDMHCDESISTLSYAQIDHSHTIQGIKLSASPHDFLLVRFGNKVRTWKLVKAYSLNNGENLDEQSAIEVVCTISERTGFQVKDACINQFNKSIQGIASDTKESYQVKLYDSSSSTSQAFQTISWPSDEIQQFGDSDSSLKKCLRGRVVSTFIPSSPAQRGLQQLDSIPSHLVNMLVTTDYRTALIDPRQDRIGQVYVDRSELPSFYPIEYLRRTGFSSRNCHQFYCLTNVHLRVFDTRYPLMPVNQINHMLDSTAYESMNLKVVSPEKSDLETLCLTTSSRLCLSTFDQSQNTPLINPKSTHLPYHEPQDDEAERLYGLDVITNLTRWNFFSVLQLSERGSICIRSFEPHPEDDEVKVDYENEVDRIIQKTSGEQFIYSVNQVSISEDLEEFNVSVSEPQAGEFEPINILEPISDLEEKIRSQRALERFEKMKNKLDTI